MILKLGMKHQAMEHYKVYINHDPGMTLTYFTARSAEVSHALEWQYTNISTFGLSSTDPL